jgi:hypothetical protein
VLFRSWRQHIVPRLYRPCRSASRPATTTSVKVARHPKGPASDELAYPGATHNLTEVKCRELVSVGLKMMPPWRRRASGELRACRGDKAVGNEPPDLSCRADRRHGDFDAHANKRAFLEQLETNGAEVALAYSVPWRCPIVAVEVRSA